MNRHHFWVCLLAMAACGLARAQPPPDSPAHEPSLAIGFDDSRVPWGPCPAFLPEGCALAVLHGDPSKPNADALLKVPAGSFIPRHWHTSPERMVLLSGQLLVTYDGQAAQSLEVGDYAYGPAKRPHQASCAKGDACVLFIAFELPIDAVPMTGVSGDAQAPGGATTH